MAIEDIVEKMRQDIRFERLGKSEAFHVSFRYGNALQAQRSEQELIDSLMAASVSMRNADTPGVHSYGLEVLDPASLPQGPSSPNRLVIASLGLAAGLLLAAVTVAVRARSTVAPAGNSPKSSWPLLLAGRLSASGPSALVLPPPSRRPPPRERAAPKVL